VRCRRVRRDRRFPDSLADLARRAVEAHADLAPSPDAEPTPLDLQVDTLPSLQPDDLRVRRGRRERGLRLGAEPPALNSPVTKIASPAWRTDWAVVDLETHDASSRTTAFAHMVIDGQDYDPMAGLTQQLALAYDRPTATGRALGLRLPNVPNAGLSGVLRRRVYFDAAGNVLAGNSPVGWMAQSELQLEQTSYAPIAAHDLLPTISHAASDGLATRPTVSWQVIDDNLQPTTVPAGPPRSPPRSGGAAFSPTRAATCRSSSIGGSGRRRPRTPSHSATRRCPTTWRGCVRLRWRRSRT
jgi:hypothetical protein